MAPKTSVHAEGVMEVKAETKEEKGSKDRLSPSKHASSDLPLPACSTSQSLKNATIVPTAGSNSSTHDSTGDISYSNFNRA